MLQRPHRDDGAGPSLAARVWPSGLPRPRRGFLARHPEWPVVATLAGWPVWWALGIAAHMFVIMAIPMVRRMYKWRAERGKRSIKLPPGFGLWLLFLVVMIAGAATLSQTAPGTVPSSVFDRWISWLVRGTDYVAITILLVYVGNLTQREITQRRLAWLLGLVGIYSVVGGVAAIFAPHLQFTSPLEVLVPQSLQNAGPLGSLRPSLAEVQNLLGYAEGRPSAPYTYTNMWGNCTAILLPWLLVSWWSYGTRKQRIACATIMVIALAPVIYSLDRGLWLGIGCAILYLGVRFAARGRIAILGALCGLIALAAVLIVATPMGTLIGTRFQHQKSNDVRSSLSTAATKAALASPLIGFGDTRHIQGSTQSIAIGKTSNCPKCGSQSIGGNGQLWLLFMASGYLGAFFYIAFFAFGIWTFRRDRTPIGLAGVLVLLLVYVFMIAYVEVGPPLAFTFIAYALLWRNQMLRQSGEEAAAVSGTMTDGDGRRHAVTVGTPA
jgi:hypothetical protein